MLAAENGHLEVVDALRQTRGVDVDQMDRVCISA